MTDLNLQEIHDFLITVAKEAGRMILSAKPSNDSSGTKKNCTCCSLPHLSLPVFFSSHMQTLPYFKYANKENIDS